MKYKFHAYGHPHILGTHKTTLEFTKDGEISLEGNCIVGVKADFELSKLRELIEKSSNNNIAITIELPDKKIKETILAAINLNFGDDTELVIRKTNFISKRTFATSSDKAAFELNREFINFLKEKKSKISVAIENKSINQ